MATFACGMKYCIVFIYLRLIELLYFYVVPDVDEEELIKQKINMSTF